MTRILTLFIVMVLITLPVSAETPLSATEVEQLPFDHSLANIPNTDPISASQIEHASTDAAHKKKAGLPQFDVTTFSSQLFWLLITFVMLYVYFAKKALPALSSAIDARKTTIKNDIDAANKISAEVDTLQTDYEAAMTNARSDARSAAMAVENEVRAKADAETDAFKEKSMTAISDLETKAEAAKEAIKSDLEIIAGELTSDIVLKLSNVKTTDAAVKKAIKAQLKGTQTPSTQKKAA